MENEEIYMYNISVHVYMNICTIFSCLFIIVILYQCLNQNMFFDKILCFTVPFSPVELLKRKNVMEFLHKNCHLNLFYEEVRAVRCIIVIIL